MVFKKGDPPWNKGLTNYLSEESRRKMGVNRRHGMKGTHFYRVWVNIRYRCNNKNSKEYPRYGGRGIKLCKRWDKFENFRDDMYETYLEHKKNNKHTTIERIDVNKGYNPKNCKWAGFKTQANNRTNSHYLTFNGHKKTAAQWAEELNMTLNTIFGRIRMGWPVEKILTTPQLKRKKPKI